MPVAEYELYRRLKLLGEGSFGKAYLVECLSDGSLYVIKQVDLSKMSEQEKKDTLKEAKILEVLRHPNIVKFREVYKTKKGKLCIVMDYADGGDLSSKVKERRGQSIPENQILDWFTQICLALKHVHDRKIIHRDLKCQNIFLTKNGIVKLGDFGIARVLSNTRENAKTMVGTPYYLSPEIIENKPYSFKSDMWSLGVVLYELCALKPPFTADSLHFLALKIVKGAYNPIPSTYSKELRGLVASLLQTDPSKRPTTNSILVMPFIQARIKNFLTESVRVTEFSHTVLHKERVNVNNIRMEDMKNVLHEAPMPDHLLKQLKQQQQLSSQPKQQIQQQVPVQGAVANDNNQKLAMVLQRQNQIVADKKQINGENLLANKVEVKNNQQLISQQKQPEVKENWLFKQDVVPNPIRQKDLIIQNIIANKEREKQAQQLIVQQNQQVAKLNYHYINQKQQQQCQLQPLSSPVSKDNHKQNFEQAIQQNRFKEQAAQKRALENPGPRLNRQPSNLKEEDKKLAAAKRLQDERKEPLIVKNQPDALPVRLKWEQKAAVNQQPQTPSSRQRDRLIIEGKAESGKPVVENSPKQQIGPVLFKKPSQRDLFDAKAIEKPVGQEAALYGAFVNPNFIGNKKKLQKVNKAQDIKPKHQEPVLKPKEQPQPVNKIAQQENVLAKLAQNNLQKQEEERLKKERQEAEQNAKKTELEKRKAEKEKEREALRQQMQKDIQQKRNMKRQAAEEFKVVFYGAKIGQEGSIPNLTGTTEDTDETQQSPGKGDRPKNFECTFNFENQGLKVKSSSPTNPQCQRRAQWQIDRNSPNSIEKEPEDAKGSYPKETEQTRHQSDEGGDLISLALQAKSRNYMSETLVKETIDFNLSISYEKSSGRLSVDAWEHQNEEDSKLAEFYEEEKKRDLQYERIKKGFLELGAFQKLNDYAGHRQGLEEVVAYEALIKELNHIVTEPNCLNRNDRSRLLKEETNDTSDDEEDRDDDMNDDFQEEAKPNEYTDLPTKKQSKPQSYDAHDFIISDYNKLESLKVFMEEAFGDEVFLKAYHITKFHKKANIEEIEAQYTKEDNYAMLFPFMSQDLRDRYIPMMFTFVIMENIAEESSAGY